MPSVPRSTQQRVGTAPLPGVRVGGGGPPAMLDLSPVQRLAEGVWEAETRRADEVAFLDADNQLATVETDLRGMAAQKRGKDAIGATAEVQAEWKKRTAEVEASLTNDRQKQAFRRRASNRWNGLYNAVESHAAGESRKYEDETFKAALINRVNDAVANAADPALRSQALAETKALVSSYATQRGLPPEARDEQIAEWQSKIHVGVMNRMVALGDDRTASAYYAENQGGVVGTDKAAVERVLEEGSLLGESQRQADAILAMPGISRTEAYEKAREETDPKLRRAITAELRGQYGLRDEATEIDRQAVIESAYADIFDNQRRPSATVLAKLSVGDRLKVLSVWEQSQKGEPVETDWATYLELQEMAATDPAAFAKLNPWDYRSKLGNTEFKQFVDAHTTRKAGRDEDEFGASLTVAQHIELVLPTVGLGKRDKHEDDEQVVRFKRGVYQRVADWKRDHQKKSIPPEELTKITDQMTRAHVHLRTRTGERESLAFGPKGVTVDERGRAFTPYREIPPDRRRAIQEEFKAVGKTATIDVIERAYAAYQMNDLALMATILKGSR